MTQYATKQKTDDRTWKYRCTKCYNKPTQSDGCWTNDNKLACLCDFKDTKVKWEKTNDDNNRPH